MKLICFLPALNFCTTLFQSTPFWEGEGSALLPVPPRWRKSPSSSLESPTVCREHTLCLSWVPVRSSSSFMGGTVRGLPGWTHDCFLFVCPRTSYLMPFSSSWNGANSNICSEVMTTICKHLEPGLNHRQLCIANKQFLHYQAGKQLFNYCLQVWGSGDPGVNSSLGHCWGHWVELESLEPCGRKKEKSEAKASGSSLGKNEGVGVLPE